MRLGWAPARAAASPARFAAASPALGARRAGLRFAGAPSPVLDRRHSSRVETPSATGASGKAAPLTAISACPVTQTGVWSLEDE